jgi:putative membrane protein
MLTVLHLLALTATVLVMSRLMPDVRVKGAGAALGVAVVFSVLNFFLGWLIRALLFMPAIMTLGVLFLFVPLIVNTALLWLTDRLMASFEIATPRGLLLTALAITVVNGLFHARYLQSAWQGPDGATHWVLRGVLRGAGAAIHALG